MALVTGAGGGTAPAVVEALRRRGWRVALVDRPGKEAWLLQRHGADDGDRAAPGPAGVDKAGGGIAAFGADLSHPGGAEAVVAAVLERFGDLHAVVNLAGGFAAGKAHEVGLAELEAMLDVNLRTAVATTRAALPVLLERGRGSVVGVSAGAASTPAPGKALYAAAKAAVRAYFLSVAAEVAGRGVDVCVLSPVGTIDTSANRAAMPNTDRAGWIAPAALADALLFLLERPAHGKVRELEVRGA